MAEVRGDLQARTVRPPAPRTGTSTVPTTQQPSDPGPSASPTPATPLQLARVVGYHLGLKVLVVLVAFATIGDRALGFWGQLERWVTAWDGIHYLHIAQMGYVRNQIPDLGDPFAFPPGYPALVALTGATWVSSLVVANTMAVAAIVLMGRWRGERAALWFSLFPLWVVYSLVGYSESTAIAFGIGAMLLASRATSWWHWLAAGAAAAGSALTRYVLGLGLAAAFGILAVRQRKALAALAPLAVAGIAAAVWMQLEGGSALAYFRSQQAWGASLKGPIAQVDWLLHGWFTNQAAVHEKPIVFVLRNLVYTAPVMWGAVLLAVRKEWSAFWLSTLMLAIVLSTVGTPAISVPRLALAAFPAVAAPGLAMGRWSLVGYAMLAVPWSIWVFIMFATSFFG